MFSRANQMPAAIVESQNQHVQLWAILVLHRGDSQFFLQLLGLLQRRIDFGVRRYYLEGAHKQLLT